MTLRHFHRKIDFLVFELSLREETYTCLIRADNCVFVKRMVLSVEHFRVKINDLTAKAVVARFITSVELSSLYLERIFYAFHILHVVVFEFTVMCAHV